MSGWEQTAGGALGVTPFFYDVYRKGDRERWRFRLRFPHAYYWPNLPIPRRLWIALSGWDPRESVE